MAARPTARFLLLTSLALVFILFVFVFRLYTPLTPQARAPGPLDKLGANVAVNEDMLAGESFMPKLGNETAKYVRRSSGCLIDDDDGGTDWRCVAQG